MNKNNKKVVIIAEAGVNHNGDVNLAKQLIDVAAEAKADYVKFQTFQSNKVISSFAEQALYQYKNTGIKESQLEMVQKLELSKQDHHLLLDHCKKTNIKFFSTSFDLPSTRFLRKLNLGLFKIPSGEITNLPYLSLIGSYNSEIILSTGMADLGEIEQAIRVLEKNGTERNKITLLHCTTEYPAPFAEVNLKAMNTLREAFGIEVGYSDHTEGIEVAIAATALGASVIEKHFTLDKSLPGPDHKASLDPVELKKMVYSIRLIEKSLGNGRKEPSQSEIRNKSVARKSIVAKKLIKKGDKFTRNNIAIKRPGNGISPMKIDDVLGRKAFRTFTTDEMIEI
jgi:N,N'-diacetyllegionaminate synthase